MAIHENNSDVGVSQQIHALVAVCSIFIANKQTCAGKENVGYKLSKASLKYNEAYNQELWSQHLYMGYHIKKHHQVGVVNN